MQDLGASDWRYLCILRLELACTWVRIRRIPVGKWSQSQWFYPRTLQRMHQSKDPRPHRPVCPFSYRHRLLSDYYHSAPVIRSWTQSSRKESFISTFLFQKCFFCLIYSMELRSLHNPRTFRNCSLWNNISPPPTVLRHQFFVTSLNLTSCTKPSPITR